MGSKSKKKVPVLPPDLPTVTPVCPVIDMCAGCPLQHIEISAQREQKEQWLREAFEAEGVAPEQWLSPLTGPAFGYRARARLSVRWVQKKDSVLVGFREHKKRFITDTTTCPILPPEVEKLLAPLRELIGGLSVAAQLPQIEATAMDGPIGLLIRHLQPLTPDDITRLTSFADEHGVRIFLQPKGYDTIHPLLESDSPTMAYTLPDFELTLRFRPEHFTQVHREVNRQMVAQAVAWLDPQPNDRIVDLYCGIGNFALPLARRGAQVLGIDYHSGQTDQAAANAAENGLKEVARFLPCDLDARPEQARVEIAGADKVLIDPPRSGAAGPVSMLPPRGAPHRIVYVSCNPETLARDAGVLTRMKGYAFRAARLVDMFPHTRHSEAMTLFER